MGIKVRVVGIFFSIDVDLGPGGGTVQQCLDAAVTASQQAGQPKLFGYLATGNSVTQMAMRAFSSFPSPTPGVGKTYPPGLYAQTESVINTPTPNPYSVWQYYIFDANNVYLNRGKGAIPFTQASVPDGGSVVWRLVSVPSGPIYISDKAKLRLGFVDENGQVLADE